MRDSETICEKQRDKFEDEKERIDELLKTVDLLEKEKLLLSNENVKVK